MTGLFFGECSGQVFWGFGLGLRTKKEPVTGRLGERLQAEEAAIKAWSQNELGRFESMSHGLREGWELSEDLNHKSFIGPDEDFYSECSGDTEVFWARDVCSVPLHQLLCGEWALAKEAGVLIPALWKDIKMNLGRPAEI
jgi:hypothetical protein